MEVHKTNFGIASRVGNIIYINKRLDRNSILKEAIIKHELNHTNGFSKKDFLNDLGIEELRGLKKEYYKFIINNPTTWIEYLPIIYRNKKILINLNLSLIWLLLIVTGIISYFYITNI